MYTELREGMDHEHYAWSPLIGREDLRWPDGARMALCVIVTLEQLDWKVPAGTYQSPGLYSHLAMQRPILEFWAISHREYGHRVGVFRVLEVLKRHGIRPTVAMDALTAAHYPYLVRHCVKEGAEIIGHGLSASQMITSRMGEEEERAYISDSIAAIESATGAKPKGWFGPEYGESTRTPRLLAEAGIRYVCDWANDEQPYRMTTPKGEIYALPMMVELDDLFSLRDRRFPIDEFAINLTDAFDAVYRDSVKTGRVLVLNIHPWLMGQPFRIRYLNDALGHMTRRQGVWAASGGEIIDWYRRNAPSRG